VPGLTTFTRIWSSTARRSASRAPETDVGSQEREPALVVTAPAHVILAVRKRETTLSDAIGRGAVKGEGSKRALRNFREVFRRPYPREARPDAVRIAFENRRSR
jgi:hypothetical protein